MWIPDLSHGATRTCVEHPRYQERPCFHSPTPVQVVCIGGRARGLMCACIAPNTPRTGDLTPGRGGLAQSTIGHTCPETAPEPFSLGCALIVALLREAYFEVEGVFPPDSRSLSGRRAIRWWRSLLRKYPPKPHCQRRPSRRPNLAALTPYFDLYASLGSRLAMLATRNRKAAEITPESLSFCDTGRCLERFHSTCSLFWRYPRWLFLDKKAT
jgi:hypothetical protein